MINSLKKLRNETENVFNFDLYIAGGFIEQKSYSVDLTNELFGKIKRYNNLSILFLNTILFSLSKGIFNSREETFDLKLFCCTELNDEIRPNGLHYPIIYGLGKLSPLFFLTILITLLCSL
jgi:hypothetical protein